MSAAAERDGSRLGPACPIVLDLDLCKACGICIAICPRQVYDRDEAGFPVIARPELCAQCLTCEVHCPDFAIAIERRVPKRSAAAAAVEGD
ncbi:MAG TPA: ferredoxin family protein [Thermoleophilia bacterium]|nr:ferredoxin family protein [Thermoleophilia bacterium]